MRSKILVGLLIGGLGFSVGLNVIASPLQFLSHSQQKTVHKSISTKININIADAKQLTRLKGIGKTRAKSIVAYRKLHGKFHSVDDLTNVKGFSKKTVAKIKKINQGRMSTI